MPTEVPSTTSKQRQRVAPAFREWANKNPDKLRDLLRQHHMISGGDWRNPDFGHFGWNRTRVIRKTQLHLVPCVAAPSMMP